MNSKTEILLRHTYFPLQTIYIQDCLHLENTYKGFKRGNGFIEKGWMSLNIFWCRNSLDGEARKSSPEKKRQLHLNNLHRDISNKNFLNFTCSCIPSIHQHKELSPMSRWWRKWVWNLSNLWQTVHGWWCLDKLFFIRQ